MHVETERRWYVRMDGKLHGPLLMTELIEKILGGSGEPYEVPIWRKGMGTWTRAGDVDDVREELPPPFPQGEPVAAERSSVATPSGVPIAVDPLPGQRGKRDLPGPLGVPASLSSLGSASQSKPSIHRTPVSPHTQAAAVATSTKRLEVFVGVIVLLFNTGMFALLAKQGSPEAIGHLTGATLRWALGSAILVGLVPPLRRRKVGAFLLVFGIPMTLFLATLIDRARAVP